MIPKQKKTKMICKPKKPEIDPNNLRAFNPALFEKLRIEAVSLWNDIAYDYLQICPGFKCSANEARSAVADRMMNPNWFTLSSKTKEDILAEAITGIQAI